MKYRLCMVVAALAGVCHAQGRLADYVGGWSGASPNTGQFAFVATLSLQSPDFTFYLSLETDEAGQYGAATYFKAPTFHYMYAQGFRHQGNTFAFRDIRSNIRFEGVLGEGKIDLALRFLGEAIKLELRRLPHADWAIGEAGARQPKSTPIVGHQAFRPLAEAIQSDTLEGTHSVLVAQGGKTIYEQYFDGFSQDIPHDTRSLSKSFASAAIGMAIADKLVRNEHVPIKPFFVDAYPDVDWGNGKDGITLFHLLTMSSGLDAIDFGLDRTSYANEGAYQNTDNWARHVLSAPMLRPPGTAANYGSGNPHLVGPILDSLLEEPMVFFLHKNLFGPLAITNYRIQANNHSQPYFGGGWYFTPRDLAKFGQLYLGHGQWQGRQILPKAWVDKSFAKHYILENTIDKNPYGYLFWHKTYQVKGKAIASIEARGNGGQYLFVVPSLDLVAVVTSGNYRNRKGFQPERIMADYILPHVVGD